MTAAQLIAQLQRLPPDTPIVAPIPVEGPDGPFKTHGRVMDVMLAHADRDALRHTLWDYAIAAAPWAKSIPVGLLLIAPEMGGELPITMDGETFLAPPIQRGIDKPEL